MTTGPTPPAKGRPAARPTGLRPTGPRPTGPRPTDARPTIQNADVPSETVLTGLPDVGEGASAPHFSRDAVQGQANDGTEEEAESRAPADPRDAPDVPG